MGTSYESVSQCRERGDKTLKEELLTHGRDNAEIKYQKERECSSYQPEQMPVDRPVDQHAQFGAQQQFGRPPGRPMKGTIDRAVDRLARSLFLLGVGRLTGRPREGSIN